MSRDELYDLFTRYVEYAGENLCQEEIPSRLVRVHEWEGDGKFAIKVDSRERLGPLIAAKEGFVESEVAEELLAFLEEEYDWDPPRRYLQLVLLKVFGEDGEHLDDWEGRAERAFEMFLEDAEDQMAKFRVKTFLEGVEIHTPEIRIADDAVLREPTPEDRSYVEDVQSSSHFNPMTMAECTSVLEFDVDNTSEYRAYPPGPIQRDMFLKVLRLYGRGNVPMLATTHELRTFLGDRMGMGVPNTKRSSLPRYSVMEGDGPKIQNLVELLAPNYSKSDSTFAYPLSAAIDHFETSIEKRIYTRESITFAVIGLESLYTSGKGKVSTYCAFLLGTVSPFFDSEDVQETLEEAYDSYRNTWAHGGSRKMESTDVQHKLWDYLRSSIVTFSWLTREDGLNKVARNEIVERLNRAFIDEDGRNELLDKLEEFEVDAYLQLPKQDVE